MFRVRRNMMLVWFSLLNTLLQAEETNQINFVALER